MPLRVYQSSSGDHIFFQLHLNPTLSPLVLLFFSCKIVSDSCDSKDCSPPDSSVRGIFHARILEWIAFPSSGDLPDLGIKPASPALQADSLPTEL